ncbi:COMM domain-containing protein 4 [Aplysia californica]|uniref:COMM domain-containing protein 4 n=1 Tax=Aplysia californica TaxID=6500 RepID=A0ABM1W278_APLCA|nr:COMM domain-containing protein 4 [Aplysia californica]
MGAVVVFLNKATSYRCQPVMGAVVMFLNKATSYRCQPVMGAVVMFLNKATSYRCQPVMGAVVVFFFQRFRFCGDLDCPDWVLAEINILSKVTSVKMKLLSVQVLKGMLGAELDYEKVHKLTSDAKFESGDIKASIAALSFILSRAARHHVDADTLANELQQLGLPKEHTSSLCKSYCRCVMCVACHVSCVHRTHQLTVQVLL